MAAPTPRSTNGEPTTAGRSAGPRAAPRGRLVPADLGLARHGELPDGRVRPTATLIYFLPPADESSAWHRVASDEVWLAHQGVVILELGGNDARPGEVVREVLAPDGQTQLVVPAGHWQRTVPGEVDALVSCLVSPGFDFEDFELLG